MSAYRYHIPHPVCGAYTLCVRTPAEKAKALAEIAACPTCAALLLARAGAKPR